MKELQKRREELEKRLKYLEDAHSKRFAHIASESAYRDSAKAINEVYKELFSICSELNDPIPVRF